MTGTLVMKKDVIRPYHDYHSNQETIRYTLSTASFTKIVNNLSFAVQDP
jgi:hypothetical protein